MERGVQDEDFAVGGDVEAAFSGFDPDLGEAGGLEVPGLVEASEQGAQREDEDAEAAASASTRAT
jgi:hypothetical protein